MLLINALKNNVNNVSCFESKNRWLYVDDTVYQVISIYNTLGSTTNRYNGDGVVVQQTQGDGTTTDLINDLVAPLSQVLITVQSVPSQEYPRVTTAIYGTERLLTRKSYGWSTTDAWDLSDGVGSLQATLDSFGQLVTNPDYDAWGNVTSSTTPTPFGFTGEYRDAATGFTYLRARWYNPASGTLLGRDPFAGNPESPYSLHPYAYGYSNPVSNTDPSGKVAIFVAGFDSFSASSESEDNPFDSWDPNPFLNSERPDPNAQQYTDGVFGMADTGIQVQGGNIKARWNDELLILDAIQQSHTRGEPIILVGHSRGGDRVYKIPYQIPSTTIDLVVILGMVDFGAYLQNESVPYLGEDYLKCQEAFRGMIFPWQDVGVVPANHGIYAKPANVKHLINLYSEARMHAKFWNIPAISEIKNIQGAANGMIAQSTHENIDDQPLTWTIIQTAIRMVTHNR